MLAKVSPIMYRIQCHAGAESEIVLADKLMPYQPDFGEELESWLQDEESGGCRATQTPMPALPETSSGVVMSRPSKSIIAPMIHIQRATLAQTRKVNLLCLLPLLDVVIDHIRSQTGTRRCRVFGLSTSYKLTSDLAPRTSAQSASSK